MMATRRKLSDNPVFDEPAPAIGILATALGIEEERALEGLRALVRAGYVIAPREPTNAMLLAYILSYGEMPTNPATVITAVAKARKRWRAMGEKGSAAALSRRRPRSVL